MKNEEIRTDLHKYKSKSQGNLISPTDSILQTPRKSNNSSFSEDEVEVIEAKRET